MMDVVVPKFCVSNKPKSAFILQENCFDVLQAEAENIRKWQVKMEIQLKEKEKDFWNANQMVDGLRRSILEVKTEKEKIAEQLREELRYRNCHDQKIESTRAMCILVKDECLKLDGTLKKCIAVSDRLSEGYDSKRLEMQNLTDVFDEVAASVKHAWEVFGREHSEYKHSMQKRVDQVVVERDQIVTQMLQSREQLLMVNDALKKLDTALKKSEALSTDFASKNTGLQNIVSSLLQTIGELAAKIKMQKREMETLAAKLCESLRKNELLEENLKTEVGKGKDLAETAKSLDIKVVQMEQACREKEHCLRELRDLVQTQTSQKDNLVRELQHRVKSLEAQVQMKTTECTHLTDKVNQQKEDLTNIAEALSSNSEENGRSSEIKQQVNELKKEKDRLTAENKILKSEADYAKQLKLQLDEIKELYHKEKEGVEKISEDCKQWERKAEDLETTASMSNRRFEEEKQELQQVLKAKDRRIRHVTDVEREYETLKKDYEALKKVENECEREYEKLLAQIQDGDRSCAELREELKEKEISLRDCQKDIHSYREQLRDAERMLQDEGQKMVLRNEKIDEQQKKIDDLTYQLETRNAVVEDVMRRISIAEGKLESKPFARFYESPNLQKRARREAKRITGGTGTQSAACARYITTSCEPTQSEVITRSIKHRTSRPISGISDAKEDLPSEVSFGSEVIACARDFSETVTASTPRKKQAPKDVKDGSQPNRIHANFKPKRKGSAKSPKLTSRKKSCFPKNSKKRRNLEEGGSLDWFETDSIYGFNE